MADFINFPHSKKYNIIYADPPWKQNKGSKSAVYPTLNIEEIVSLPVKSIAANDAMLFLWVTNTHLEQIFKSDLIKSWGFNYKTTAFHWVKTTKNNKFYVGMGNWTRANPEICLFATRGRPQRLSRSVFSLVMSQIREHSRKPDEVRDRIIELAGDLPRVELFARQQHAGWDCWGNEMPNNYYTSRAVND